MLAGQEGILADQDTFWLAMRHSGWPGDHSGCTGSILAGQERILVGQESILAVQESTLAVQDSIPAGQESILTGQGSKPIRLLTIKIQIHRERNDTIEKHTIRYTIIGSDTTRYTKI